MCLTTCSTNIGCYECISSGNCENYEQWYCGDCAESDSSLICRSCDDYVCPYFVEDHVILARNAGLSNVMTAHRFCTIAICVSDGSVPRASNRMERDGSITRKTTWHVSLLPLQKCQPI